MQPAQLSMMQQQQSAAAAAQQQQVQQAQQQQQRPQPTMQQAPQQAGSEFVRMELRQSLQAKQQMAGRKWRLTLSAHSHRQDYCISRKTLLTLLGIYIQ